MGRLAGEAIEAGALGFTTSRTLNHRTSTGRVRPRRSRPRPTSWSASPSALGDLAGVLQVVSDFADQRRGARDGASGWPRRPAGRCRSRSPRPTAAGRLARPARRDHRGQRRGPAGDGPGRGAGRRHPPRPPGDDQPARCLAPRRAAWPTCRSTSASSALREPDVRDAVILAEIERSTRAAGPAATGCSRWAIRPTTSPRPRQSVAARAARAGRDAGGARLRPRCSADGGTALLYVAVPQLRRRQPRRGRARCSPTRTPCSASATAAPTSARSATPASRPRCSPTGCATAPAARTFDLAHVVANADLADGCGGRAARPWRARSRVCAPTSTSSTSTRSACTRRRS